MYVTQAELITFHPLVAAAESSAHRRARVALQLRDRHGRWIEMGGGLTFHMRTSGSGPPTAVHGEVVGGDNATQQVHLRLENGAVVSVPANKTEQAKAIIGLHRGQPTPGVAPHAGLKQLQPDDRFVPPPEPPPPPPAPPPIDWAAEGRRNEEERRAALTPEQRAAEDDLRIPRQEYLRGPATAPDHSALDALYRSGNAISVPFGKMVRDGIDRIKAGEDPAAVIAGMREQVPNMLFARDHIRAEEVLDNVEAAAIPGGDDDSTADGVGAGEYTSLYRDILRTGVTPERAQIIDDTLRRLYEQYGQQPDYVGTVAQIKARWSQINWNESTVATMGHDDETGKTFMGLDADSVNDYENLLNRPGSDPNWTVTKTVEELINHEFGHLLDFTHPPGEEDDAVYRQIARDHFGGDIDKLHLALKHVSMYAGTHRNEAVAEAFALYKKDPTGSPPWLQEWGRAMDDLWSRPAHGHGHDHEPPPDPGDTTAGPSSTNHQEAAGFERWAKNELARLKAANEVAPGNVRYSREDGRRAGRIQAALTWLNDSASDGYFGGYDALDQPLNELLPDHEDLVSEYQASRNQGGASTSPAAAANSLASWRETIAAPANATRRAKWKRDIEADPYLTPEMKKGLFVDIDRPARGANKRQVTRADDLRKTGGQTRTNFINETTGAPMGKTETGDTFERLFDHKGKQLLEHRYGEFELVTGAGGGSSRTTPLDLRTTTHGGELKTMSSKSKNLKTAIKADEVQRKLEAVGSEKLKPLLLVQVVDQDNHRIELYGMETFGSKAVSKMEHFGGYDYSPEDFRAAQAAAGHDEKAVARAFQAMTPEQKQEHVRLVQQGLAPREAARQALAPSVQTGNSALPPGPQPLKKGQQITWTAPNMRDEGAPPVTARGTFMGTNPETGKAHVKTSDGRRLALDPERIHQLQEPHPAAAPAPDAEEGLSQPVSVPNNLITPSDRIWTKQELDAIPMTEPERLNFDEREAVSEYRLPDNAVAINEALRAGTPLSEITDEWSEPDEQPYQDIHDQLLSIAERSTLSAPLVSYRGMNLDELPEPGQTISQKGWSSATVNQEFARGISNVGPGEGRAGTGTPVLMEINAPEGTHVINTHAEDTGELIFPPDTPFRIDSVTTDPDGLVHVKASIPSQAQTTEPAAPSAPAQPGPGTSEDPLAGVTNIPRTNPYRQADSWLDTIADSLSERDYDAIAQAIDKVDSLWRRVRRDNLTPEQYRSGLVSIITDLRRLIPESSPSAPYVDRLVEYARG